MKTNNLNITELTQKISEKDRRYAQILRVMKTIYWIVVIGTILNVAIKYFTNEPINALTTILNILGYSCFLFSFILYDKEFKKRNYALPTIEMLKKFRNRYKIFHPYSIWALLGIVCILCDTYIREGGDKTIIFIIIFAISLVFGTLLHWIKIKPLTDSAKQLIKELEEV